MTDRQFLTRKRWLNTRIIVLKRDKYRCQKCGKPGKEVHHKIPRSQLHESRWHDTSNLEVLCKVCHNLATNLEIKAAKMIPVSGWL